MESPPPPPPNDPQKVVYPPARPAIVRSEGGTPSERYLAKLADKSFLNLWCYPNVFIDKKRAGGKGDGKELCDLLVVCGDHVLVFSDKTVAFPEGEDKVLAWKRWSRRAIAKSVDQIRGAERWITHFPERIFIDRKCTQKLPIALPPPDRRKVHGIVVALGAGEASKRYFGGGIGSLAVTPDIKGAAHWEGDSVAPFLVGDVDPDGPFVHVLDDATLDIVLGELNTIIDLTAYLTKKEALIRSGRLISAGGEEDLVAYYMTHMNPEGEHDFTRPDGSPLGADDHITFDPGIHADMLQNVQYLAKKEADDISYLWDRLIEAFTNHMLAGTTLVPDGQSFDLSELEQGIRHMALVPRYLRRVMGEGIRDALEKGRAADRFTRAFLPGPTEANQETAFFFMTLDVPKFSLGGGYEQYRAVRRNMLETYALAFLQKNPQLKRVVGIATEPPAKNGKAGASEDLLVVEDVVWSDCMLKDLAERKKVFNVMQEGNFTEYPVQGNEFPEVVRQADPVRQTPMKREQQRRLKAELRRRERKGR
jgi:hypothetical protein